MSSELKHRRGTAAAHASFIGAQGEITVKTDTNEIVVHDGVTPGGKTGGGYMPAGTGAVPTTVQAKLREGVSVKDFGAVGDGVTDDTAAIQKARNEASIGRSIDYQGKTFSPSYWENLAPLATEWIHGGPTNYTTDQQSTKPLTWAKNFVGLPMTQLGYQHYAAAWDSYTKASTDIQSGATAVFRMNSYSTNSLGTDFNKTNQVAIVANATALSATASASVEAINAIADSVYTGSTPQMVIGVEADLSTANPPGFFGEASKAYSVGFSSVWKGLSSQDGTVAYAAGTSNSTYSWLHGMITAGVKTTGLTITRNGALRPTTGVWVAAASTYGIYVGGKPLYSMNPGQGGDYSYVPAVGIALGQSGATSANSHKLRMISTDGASAEQNVDLYVNTSNVLQLDFAGSNKFGFSATGNIYVQGNIVIGARKTGYSAMTGTVNRATSYATSTITLQQLAERVAAIQADLTAHGLIGA